MSSKLAITFLLLAATFSPSLARMRTRAARFMEADNVVARDGQSYGLQHKYQGQDFLSWNFYSQADPTHGLVNYLPQDQASQKNLATVDNNTFVMSVGDLQSDGNRDSVRISSPDTYNGGLFIADFQAMPFGCSMWPAYWSVGGDWPNNGEIDVIEGVNDGAVNQATLHTSAGCSGTSDASQMSGKILGTTCASSGDDNSGCGVQDTDPQSFGQGFNDAGGGVYAHLWNDEGIKMWFWTRNAIPQDITSGQPDPSTWGLPFALWSSNGCDIQQHFIQHSLTLNIALCGDWANGAYSSSSCANAQQPTCADAVKNDDNFKNAKWVVNSISVYQPQ